MSSYFGFGGSGNGNGNNGNGSSSNSGNRAKRSSMPIPQDIVSCPPALSVKKSNKTKVKRFVPPPADIEAIPVLSDIEEGSERRSESTSSRYSIKTKESYSYIKQSGQFDDLDKDRPDPPPAAPSPRQKKRESSSKRQDGKKREVLLADTKKDREKDNKDKDKPTLRNISKDDQPKKEKRSERKQEKEKVRIKSKSSNVSRRPAQPSRRRLSSVSVYSYDSMSVSTLRSAATSITGSIYTTATIISRRPAWGHYVVGVLIFLGWVMHHQYFDRHFQPVFDAAKSADKYRNVVYVDENTKPSMLRGVMNSEATVYVNGNGEHSPPANNITPLTKNSVARTRKTVLRADVDNQISKTAEYEEQTR